MHRTYIVHMMAFCEPDNGCGPSVIRPVRVPLSAIADAEDTERELSQIFYYGQNDFCKDPKLTQTCPSVSAGDVVEFSNGEFWAFNRVGFQELTKEQFDRYCEMDRRDRCMATFDFLKQVGVKDA